MWKTFISSDRSLGVRRHPPACVEDIVWAVSEPHLHSYPSRAGESNVAQPRRGAPAHSLLRTIPFSDYGIQPWYSYPKTPKMNAHCERFNRTLQETFVDYHEDLLFTDLKEFNRKLAQWLLAYNTVLPHHSLNGFSPLQFLIQHNKKCQRYWTYTPP